VVDHFGDNDVRLAIEALKPLPDETNFINRMSQAAELADMVGASGIVELHLDTKAQFPQESSLIGVVEEFGSRIISVHLNEPDGGWPCEGGEIPYAGLDAALTEAGYDGALSIEAFVHPGGAQVCARESVPFLRRTMPSLQS
jgi:sugar phosphate isomerase/epimerase